MKALIEHQSAAFLNSWHRGGFVRGVTISQIKSALQKACRQFTDGADKKLDKQCKFLGLQCVVSAAALIQHLVAHVGRACDAKALHTNIWNRLIVMAINEDTVDINGLFCLHSILVDYEATHDIQAFDPIAFIHATYQAWYCLAKTEKCRVSSWIAPLFSQVDSPSYSHLKSKLLVPCFDNQSLQDAYKSNDFESFLAQLLGYDALCFNVDEKDSKKKKAKMKWIDDLFVSKLGMTAEQAAMVVALMTRKDENDRMRLHVAVMLFYHQSGMLVDQASDYRSLLTHRRTFKQSDLCALLEKTIEDGQLTVGQVQFVYDQHTGCKIQDPNGSIVPFAQAGALVNHRAVTLSQLLALLEQAYIQKSRELTKHKKVNGTLSKTFGSNPPIRKKVKLSASTQPIVQSSSQVYKLLRVIEILGFKPNPAALVVTFQGIPGEHFVKLGGSVQEQRTAASLSHKMSQFGLFQPTGVTADVQVLVDVDFHSKIASFRQTLSSDPSRARELKWIARLVTLNGPLHPTSSGTYPMLLMPRLIGATKLCDLSSTFWTAASADVVADFIKVLIARRLLMITDTNCFNITFLEASGTFFSTDHNMIKNKNDRQRLVFESFTLKTAQPFKAAVINMVTRCSRESALVGSLLDFCDAVVSQDLSPSSQQFLLRLGDFLRKEMYFPVNELLK